MPNKYFLSGAAVASEFVEPFSLRSHSWLLGVLVKILWAAFLEFWYRVTVWMDPVLCLWTLILCSRQRSIKVPVNLCVE